MITNLSQDLSPLEARSCSMCRVTTRRNLRSKFIEILFLIIMRLSSLQKDELFNWLVVWSFFFLFGSWQHHFKLPLPAISFVWKHQVMIMFSISFASKHKLLIYNVSTCLSLRLLGLSCPSPTRRLHIPPTWRQSQDIFTMRSIQLPGVCEP